MIADASHQVTQKKPIRVKHVHDSRDFVKLVEGSGVRTMLTSGDYIHFEDGISRSQPELLAQGGPRPHLKDVEELQVRRGSEKVYLETFHKQQSWRGYQLLRSNFRLEFSKESDDRSSVAYYHG